MPAMRTGWLLESRIRLPDVCQKPVPAAWAWDWRRAWPMPRPSRTTIRTAAARRSSAERAEPLTMNVGSTVFPRHEISGMLESALTHCHKTTWIRCQVAYGSRGATNVGALSHPEFPTDGEPYKVTIIELESNYDDHPRTEVPSDVWSKDAAGRRRRRGARLLPRSRQRRGPSRAHARLVGTEPRAGAEHGHVGGQHGPGQGQRDVRPRRRQGERGERQGQREGRRAAIEGARLTTHSGMPSVRMRPDVSGA